MKVVVARVMENNILRGFATVDSNDGYTLVKLDNCSAHVYCNAKYDFEYKTLVGTQGSLTKYPTLDISGKLVTKNGLAIVSTNGVEYIGFDALGKRYSLDYKGLMKVPIKSNFTLENGNVLSKGLPFIYTGEARDDRTKIKTVKVGKVGRGDALLRASTNIKKVAPYYSYCLDSVKRKSTNSVERFACTEDTVFWNNDYCETISVGQITFGFLHEILHIVMLHSIRGRNKNHKLWNIATDLYINSILMQNFGLYLGCEEIKINGGVMALPENIVTMESIGETIDLKRDTPESIYSQLVKENPEEDDQSNGNGNGSGSGGDSSDDNDDSSDSSENGSNEDSSQNGESKSQNGSSGDNGDSSSTDDGSGDDFGDGGTDGVKEDDFGGCSQSEVGSGSGTTKEVSVRYHGKIIKGVVSEDIYTNNADPSPDAVQQNIDRAKEILQNIKTSVAIAEREGHSVEKNAMIEREIDFGLALGVDWRNVLRKYCNRKPKKTFTLGNPNRDYMSLGMTLADRHRIGKNEGFEDIKIAIDVSGSVSKKELDYFLSEVSNILRYYKTDGELIYWSDTVNSTGRFKDVRDLLKIKAKTGISTNVYGVFDYIAKQGKRPACIVIITDGYFSHNYAEFAKYFANNTIWLIYGNARQFTPCFGRVIQMEEKK